MSLPLEDRSPDRARLVLHGRAEGVDAARVWHWWVTPARLVRWWPQVAEVHPGENGGWILRWPSQHWVLRGDFVEWQPHQRLVVGWSWDHQPTAPPTTVQLDLVERDGGVDFTIQHGPYTDDAEAQEARQGHHDGWQHFVGQLLHCLRAPE